jgi:hypothetical protein
MANVLKDEKKQQIIALGRLGWSLRKIQEAARVRRETISAYLRGAGVEIWPPGRWKRESKAKPAMEVITGSDAAKPAIAVFAGPLNPKPNPKNLSTEGKATAPSKPAILLNKIDEILAWERKKEMERDTKFVELGRYQCEVRAGQYWKLEDLKCFDEFLERRFPGSRRKAYYLMSIHEHLPPQARKQLKEVGWTKGLELAKLARMDRQHFDCATWLHRAREMPKEQFKQEVERELTGKETEPWEIIYFKLYQSQTPVIERAIRDRVFDVG